VVSVPVFGTKFGIGWPFLVLLAVYCLLGMAREAVIALLSVACHEVAHALVASAYDIRVESVELVPFGGVARVSGLMEFDPRVETSVALAGPASSFLLAALGAALMRAGIAPQDTGLIVDFNLLLGVLNLLPALPLDGGRVTRAVLATRTGFREATRSTALLGKALAVLLALAALFLVSMGQFWPNLLIISAFIWAFAAGEQARAEFAFFRFLLTKKEGLGKSGMLLQEHFSALSSLTLDRVARSFSPRRYSVITVLGSTLEPIGTVDETQVIAAILSGHGRATLEDLVLGLTR
jgi:stage IV sporulation protein FB